VMGDKSGHLSGTSGTLDSWTAENVRTDRVLFWLVKIFETWFSSNSGESRQSHEHLDHIIAQLVCTTLNWAQCSNRHFFQASSIK
jgi:hypothetical protein